MIRWLRTAWERLKALKESDLDTDDDSTLLSLLWTWILGIVWYGGLATLALFCWIWSVRISLFFLIPFAGVLRWLIIDFTKDMRKAIIGR